MPYALSEEAIDTHRRIATKIIAPSLPERSHYYPMFDWLRAVLAIVVMAWHDDLIAWTHAGKFAVDIFFGLSGWLIGSVLLSMSPGGLPRFFFNRGLRIWIPYYIALALLIAVSLLKDNLTAKWAEFVAYDTLMVWNLFGTQQLHEYRMSMPLQGTANHFWSVNAEEQFYLLSPLLLVLAPTWGRSIWLWSAFAIGAWYANVYPAIILGVLAAVIASRRPEFHQIPWVRSVIYVAGVATAFSFYAGVQYELVAPLCALCIVLALAVKGRATTAGAIAGGMSYPLYLNHWIGVFVANALLSPYGMRESLSRKLLACMISIMLAVGLYMLVDRQLLKRRAGWYSERRGRFTTIAAYLMTGIGVIVGLCLTR